MASDNGPWPSRDLARPDVGDTVDGRQAVATVPGETESSLAGALSRADDGDGDRIARRERDRTAVDNDPAGFGLAQGTRCSAGTCPNASAIRLPSCRSVTQNDR